MRLLENTRVTDTPRRNILNKLKHIVVWVVVDAGAESEVTTQARPSVPHRSYSGEVP
jgi:hypothetical protein